MSYQVPYQQRCKKRKKYLLNALAKAKEVWTARKRPCREDEYNELALNLLSSSYDLDTAIPSQTSSVSSEQLAVDGVAWECNLWSRLDIAVPVAAADTIKCNVSVIVNVNNLMIDLSTSTVF